MQENRIKVAINPNIVDKHIKGNTYYLGNGWKNVELTVEELIAHVLDGHPYCAQLNSDNRAAKNYRLTNLISIDVDAGTTLGEALDHEFSQKHLTVVIFSKKRPPRMIESSKLAMIFIGIFRCRFY